MIYNCVELSIELGSLSKEFCEVSLFIVESAS